MLPKKKAKELLEIYANLDYRLIDPDFSLKIKPKHKSRALVCLNQMIMENHQNFKTKKMNRSMIKKRLSFWLEVQKEIIDY